MDSIKSAQFERKIVLKNFYETAEALKKSKIDITSLPPSEHVLTFDVSGGKIQKIEEKDKYQVNLVTKLKAPENRAIVAYDESIQKYSALEGCAYVTSHSLVKMDDRDYCNFNLISLYFITSAIKFHRMNKFVIYSTDPEAEYKKLYASERTQLLYEKIPEHSIAFIDGPIFGGQLTGYNKRLNKLLLSKDIIPVFFVKNSNSRLVIESDPALKDSYNSDFHWAYSLLSLGERTSLFIYTDQVAKENQKVFCYFMGMPNFPQRIEFHIETYKKYCKIMPELFELIYYLIAINGNHKNPQLRPIVIAEKYAREALKCVNISERLKTFWIIPTINQQRFM